MQVKIKSLPLHRFRKEVDMVDVAQLVRASDCGSEGRGFEPHLPPIKIKSLQTNSLQGFFVYFVFWGVLFAHYYILCYYHSLKGIV